jgi:hypothetical protein
MPETQIRHEAEKADDQDGAKHPWDPKSLLGLKHHVTDAADCTDHLGCHDDDESDPPREA